VPRGRKGSRNTLLSAAAFAVPGVRGATTKPEAVRWYDSPATASAIAGSLRSPSWHALSTWSETLTRSTSSPAADTTLTPNATSASATSSVVQYSPGARLVPVGIVSSRDAAVSRPFAVQR
jgi:hypothetical protein